jgi:glutamate-ammonia-ligase adenylyltransferase
LEKHINMQEALADRIHTSIPSLTKPEIMRLLDVLPEERINRLPPSDIADIIAGLSLLGPDHPVELLFLPGRNGDGRSMELYILGYDHAQLFSILTGVLAAQRLDIREGQLITSRRLDGRRLIIDYFSGILPPETKTPVWSRKTRALVEEFYQILEVPGDKDPEMRRERIQQRIIELVSSSLEHSGRQRDQLLNPMHIRIEQLERSTRIELKSSDTPFFLFSLSSVLNLHRLRIESVNIDTKNGRLIDSLECTDMRGSPIISQRKLDRIRLSILISKQFTYFLDQAPDPSKALVRFDSLIQDLGQARAGEDIRGLLASPEFHGELALLLGTSDFIWEDFIRIQRDSILPLLRNLNPDSLLSVAPEEVESALDRHLADHAENGDRDAVIRELNAFKNRQSFLIDLDHILVRDLDFFFLSRRLSALADAVIRRACAIAWEAMTEQYGTPRTAGGLETHWAVFGLGKLGGNALGYASDLELLFAYSDSGQSDGPRPVANRDFFEKMFKYASGVISAKKEGIFQVDLRLRPYGEDGPVAVKLDTFSSYYREDGKAHSAERLALVRLRHIGGNSDLGREVLSLRDHIVYESDAIEIAELRDLRRVQLKEKLQPGRTNAKFAPGGLVDLEYNVQILQVSHGRSNEALRGPGIHAALEALSELGTIDPEEARAMIGAYRFHRNLINGLRMLRGNAEDLFLPPAEEREFRHLARRIGYRRDGELSEADQLKIDFETHSARVRRFVERHLGRDAIPGERRLTIVDLVLGRAPVVGGEVGAEGEEAALIFASAGFTQPRKALVNLLGLQERSASGAEFLKLIILAWERIIRCADPDMALNNWEQFVRQLEDPDIHFRQLLSQPRRMDILFRLLSSSQFLADTLIANPAFFLWSTDPDVVTRPRTQIEMEEAFRAEAAAASDRQDWQRRLRILRKREILRIGVRDIALGVKIEEIMGEISFLARSCCEVCLAEAWRRESDAPQDAPENLSVLGFGKLGGWELNYSSDIDLLAIYRSTGDADRDAEKQLYTRVFREFVKDINDFTSEGQAYRVDLRLRPYGASGPLISSDTATLAYYRRQAAPWEFQALIKLKPVAGNLVLGEEFLEQVKPLFHQVWEETDPRTSIRDMREKSIAHHVGGSGSDLQEESELLLPGFDVKNDRGGIRDIEFFLQGMQMLYSREYPEILTGNSLRGLRLLERAGLIDADKASRLDEYYRLFRRVEHYLQLVQNRQEHRLPAEEAERDKLARSVSPDIPPESFYRYFGSALKEAHRIYREFIYASPSETV